MLDGDSVSLSEERRGPARLPSRGPRTFPSAIPEFSRRKTPQVDTA
jgi:hypothetical protein